MQEVAYDYSGTCPIVLGKYRAQNVETTIDDVVENSQIKMEGNVKTP